MPAGPWTYLPPYTAAVGATGGLPDFRASVQRAVSAQWTQSLSAHAAGLQPSQDQPSRSCLLHHAANGSNINATWNAPGEACPSLSTTPPGATYGAQVGLQAIAALVIGLPFPSTMTWNGWQIHTGVGVPTGFSSDPYYFGLIPGTPPVVTGMYTYVAVDTTIWLEVSATSTMACEVEARRAAALDLYALPHSHGLADIWVAGGVGALDFTATGVPAGTVRSVQQVTVTDLHALAPDGGPWWVVNALDLVDERETVYGDPGAGGSGTITNAPTVKLGGTVTYRPAYAMAVNTIPPLHGSQNRGIEPSIYGGQNIGKLRGYGTGVW